MEYENNIQTNEATPTKVKKYAIWIRSAELKDRIRRLRKETRFGVEDFFNFVLNIYEGHREEHTGEISVKKENDGVQ